MSIKRWRADIRGLNRVAYVVVSAETREDAAREVRHLVSPNLQPDYDTLRIAGTSKADVFRGQPNAMGLVPYSPGKRAKSTT